MKKKIYPLILFTMLGFVYSQFATANPLPSNVTLPAGTLVLLETNEQLKSEVMTVGRIVKCRVIADVVVDGKVVIRTGAVATARVKRIQPTTYNESERLTLVALSAKAVDGQMIALSGTEQTTKGLMPNEPVRVHIGTPLNGNVVNNYSVCP